MGAALVFVIILGREADDLRLGTVGVLWLVHVVAAQVNLAVKVEITAGCIADLGALGGFALLLSKGTLLIDLVTIGEFLSDSLGSSSCYTTGQPWVTNNIGNAETLVRVELEHAGDQVLELFGVKVGILAVGVCFPEEI